MRPFPPSAELQMFIGDALSQVRIDPYGLQFSFESERLIYVESKIIHMEPDGTAWPYDCHAENRPPTVFYRLLNRAIRHVEREDLRLTFMFEDGSSLAIVSDEDGFESGAIVTSELGYTTF